jgi:hypothetical protein
MVAIAAVHELVTTNDKLKNVAEPKRNLFVLKIRTN